MVIKWWLNNGDNSDGGHRLPRCTVVMIKYFKLYKITVLVNLFHLRRFPLQSFADPSHVLFHFLRNICHIFYCCFIFN